jgi:hypothetical protein
VRIWLGVAAILVITSGCATFSGKPVAEGARTEAPAWVAGLWWHYTIVDERGLALGWINYTVVGEQRVEDVTDRAWVIRTLRFDHGDVDHDGEADQVVARDVLYDAATLNIVWNVCGTPFVYGACAGRDPELDFPLWDGKAWRSTSGGDVIIESANRAVPVPSNGTTLWRTVREGIGVSWEPRVDLYDPTLRFYRERHPGGSETWRLDASGVAVPSR